LKFTGSHRRFLWWAWVAWIVVVIVMSVLPESAPPIELLSHFSDKLMHFIAYGVLGLLPVLALESRPAAAAAVLAMVVLGFALEGVQALVPGRSFDLLDFAADNLGVLSGAAFGLVLRYVMP
jgi:VanZ family protein